MMISGMPLIRYAAYLEPSAMRSETCCKTGISVDLLPPLNISRGHYNSSAAFVRLPHLATV